MQAEANENHRASSAAVPEPMKAMEPDTEMMFDIETKRPACVILQAAFKCGAHPHAIRHFPASSWLTFPTPGMRRIRATDEEWKAIAEKFCK
jgi:hypothetical protein